MQAFRSKTFHRYQRSTNHGWWKTLPCKFWGNTQVWRVLSWFSIYHQRIVQACYCFDCLPWFCWTSCLAKYFSPFPRIFWQSHSGIMYPSNILYWRLSTAEESKATLAAFVRSVCIVSVPFYFSQVQWCDKNYAEAMPSRKGLKCRREMIQEATRGRRN